MKKILSSNTFSWACLLVLALSIPTLQAFAQQQPTIGQLVGLNVKPWDPDVANSQKNFPLLGHGV